MKKLLLILCLLFLLIANTFSQTVYELNLKKELVIGALSLGIGVTPFFVKNEPKTFPGTLNKNNVNSFDKPLMFSYKKTLDIVSDNSAYVIALLPIISVIPNKNEKNTLLTYGIMYSEALLLTFGTTFTLKNAIIRYRPYMYTDNFPKGKENDYYNSFPSASAAFSFLSASFVSATFSQEFSDSKWKFPVIIGSYTLAATFSYLRVVSGAHFLSDVLTSAAICSAYGWLIPSLHLKKNNEKIAIVPTGNGIIVSIKN